ncbi:MAG: CBS domain-containing protein, partial [Deltaproteobacteria bacterium]
MTTLKAPPLRAGACHEERFLRGHRVSIAPGRPSPVDKPFSDWYIHFQRRPNPLMGEKVMQVKKLMAKKLVTIPPGTSILKAMEVMRKHSIRHLPVVDEEK